MTACDPKATFKMNLDGQKSMINLRIGGILLVAGAALFLLSDTIFGDSEAASYSMFFGLLMFPLGLILTLVGLVQVFITRIKNRSK